MNQVAKNNKQSEKRAPIQVRDPKGVKLQKVNKIRYFHLKVKGLEIGKTEAIEFALVQAIKSLPKEYQEYTPTEEELKATIKDKLKS